MLIFYLYLSVGDVASPMRFKCFQQLPSSRTHNNTPKAVLTNGMAVGSFEDFPCAISLNIYSPQVKRVQPKATNNGGERNEK